MFYEASAQTWGFDSADRVSWGVLHSIDGSETPAPSNAAEFTQLPIAADQIVSFPHWHEVVLSPLASSRFDDFFSLVDEIAPDGWPRQANHQIGGWPLLEQGSLWLATQLASNGLYVGNSNQHEHPRYPALARDRPIGAFFFRSTATTVSAGCGAMLASSASSFEPKTLQSDASIGCGSSCSAGKS